MSQVPRILRHNLLKKRLSQVLRNIFCRTRELFFLSYRKVIADSTTFFKSITGTKYLGIQFAKVLENFLKNKMYHRWQEIFYRTRKLLFISYRKVITDSKKIILQEKYHNFQAF